ncbi:hypothetical protein Dimus_027942, partial [Dionaea muscipula]
PKHEAKANEMKEWDAPVSKRTLAKVSKIRRVPRATDGSAVVPGVSTSATTSGALILPIAYTLPWVSCVEGPPLRVSFVGALLVPVPDTCTEWAERADRGLVVRVEKPVVSVQTVMIELVRTPPHPELQTSRDNYVGVARSNTPKRDDRYFTLLP